MSYRGRLYTGMYTAAEVLDYIKAHLLECGWKLTGPSINEAARIAQDDRHGYILGWFLHSNGEDGTRDIHLHLGLQSARTDRTPYPTYAYLTTNIASDAGTIPVSDGTLFAANDIIRIGTETIKIGGVSSNNLTGCTRGFWNSSSATHQQREVAALVATAAGLHAEIFCDLYSYRDTNTALASSDDSGGITWTLGASASTGAVVGFDDFKTNGFRYGALLKITEGPQTGRMRIIIGDAAGELTYAPFYTAPGAVNCEIYSLGFLPAVSRKEETGVNWAKNSTSMGLSGTGITGVYVVANKDGFAIVHRSGLGPYAYYPYYFGSYIPVGCPVIDVISSSSVPGGNVAAGATTVAVQYPGRFQAGQKCRVLSQSVLDWVANWDRSADESMGASPGSWPDLDVDELPTELVVIDSVDEQASTITFTAGLIYSYTAYAVIGSDPQPIVSYARSTISGTTNMLSDTENALMSPFNAVPASELDSNPHHRVRWRCSFNSTFGVSKYAWEGGAGRRQATGEAARESMLPFETALLEEGAEAFSEAFPLIPFSVGLYDATDRSDCNQFNRVLGYLPFLYRTRAPEVESGDPLTGQPMKVMWNFELVDALSIKDDNASKWIVLAPMIDPS